ncbi:MAG: tyrosine-type recombinase/integrase, partial [Nitrospirota bacterium]|nr:tyrosine-type recombinase/integrase [Nitrospirota bacterium]
MQIVKELSELLEDSLILPVPLTYNPSSHHSEGLSMAGKIRIREKCPQCGKPFKIIEEVDIFCPACNTRPKTFYIFLYHDKGKYRISRDTDGHILDSYRRAHRLLEAIRKDRDSNIFRISNYLAREIEEFRGHKLFTQWLNVKKEKDLSPWHMRNIEGYIDKYYLPFFERIDCRKINSDHVERFFLSLPHKLGLKTKQNIMMMLKNFCYYLLRREIISRMPYFEPLSPPQPPIVWITKEDQWNIIQHIQPPHRPIFYFLMYHPVRISEATALKVKDFNLKSRSVHLCRAFSDKVLRHRKNKRCYYLPLSSQFDTIILRNKLPEAFAFVNSKGTPYQGNGLRKMWKRACKNIGIDIKLKNATRHSIASQAINEGVSIEVISKALGHSSLEFTRQRYASIEVERLLVVVDGNLIS